MDQHISLICMRVVIGTNVDPLIPLFIQDNLVVIGIKGAELQAYFPNSSRLRYPCFLFESPSVFHTLNFADFVPV